MRRLIFATQKLESTDPILAATVAKVRRLPSASTSWSCSAIRRRRGSLRRTCACHEFGATHPGGARSRFTAALARELRPRPIGVVAHMIPLYVVACRAARAPAAASRSLLWYTHWKGHSVVRAAEKVCTAVVSVDARSFPLPSKKVRGIGHGIDIAEFSCSDAPESGGPLRALVLGRYSPAKGLETVLRGAALAGGVRLEAHGSTGDGEYDAHKRDVERLAKQLGLDAELGGPVPRAEIPALFARSDVLVNNMRAGAPDKVVYEAAASCLPVLASNPVFDDLLPPDLRFDRDDPESLAERLRTLDRRRRPELRALVSANHSVEHWADGVLATVEGR